MVNIANELKALLGYEWVTLLQGMAGLTFSTTAKENLM